MVYRIANAAGRVVLGLLGVRFRVSGADHLPRSGPVILALNHVGYLDFVMAERAAVERGRFVRFLCRRDIWLPGPLSWAMDAMGHVPVDREAPAHAYLLARRRLRAGEAVGIFPEAGISWSYTVRALMPGAVALAAETGAPLVPAAQWGSQRIWSVGRPVDGRKPRPSLRRGRVVDVRYGEPMTVAPDADVAAGTAELGRRLTVLLEELQRRPEHRPPPQRPGHDRPAPWYPAHLGGDAPDRLEAASYETVPHSAVTPTWGPQASLGPGRPGTATASG